MTLNATTTKFTTVRDNFNSGILGKIADASEIAALGDMLAVLLDAANPSVSVNATTIGAAPTQTGATVATTNAATQSGSYVQADVQTIATLANALKVDYNKTITDVAALVTAITALRVDVLALRASLASALTGTMGGATETGVTVTSNAATMAAAASTVISVRATTGTTTGVKTLIMDPNRTLATGEVFWNGNTGLKFAAIDAVTACDLIYSKADNSQKVSCLMSSGGSIV
jgi:hypothetical protein